MKLLAVESSNKRETGKYLRAHQNFFSRQRVPSSNIPTENYLSR